MVTSSQGNTTATTAARRMGNAVVSDDVCASTHTISPDVLASAALIAAEMRAWSCSEMFVTSVPKPHRRLKSLHPRRNRHHLASGRSKTRHVQNSEGHSEPRSGRTTENRVRQ